MSKEKGTEIRLFTVDPNTPSIKIKFLESDKGTLENVVVAVSDESLFNLDVLTLASVISTQIVDNLGKKITKPTQIYQFLQEKISDTFVTNFEVIHLKIHPILQVRKAGPGFTRFTKEVKEKYLFEPKKRFEEMLKKEKGKKDEQI